MSFKTLADQVRAYLDLQACLHVYSTAGVQLGRAARELELDLARKDILSRLVAPTYRDSADNPLTEALRAYFDAQDEFARCTSRGSGLDCAARRMERARRELVEQLTESDTSAGDSAQSPAAAPSPLRPLRILIAVDRSEPALWAFEVAADIAKRTSAAQVLLVHVVPPPTSLVGEFVLVLEDLDAKNHREGEALLKKLRTMLPPSAASRQMVRDGVPADEVIDAAKTWEADLIVIGTHGRGRVAKFLLGSTAEDVIRGAPCPVVTVAQPPRSAGAHEQTPPRERTAPPLETSAVPA